MTVKSEQSLSGYNGLRQTENLYQQKFTDLGGWEWSVVRAAQKTGRSTRSEQTFENQFPLAWAGPEFLTSSRYSNARFNVPSLQNPFPYATLIIFVHHEFAEGRLCLIF